MRKFSFLTLAMGAVLTALFAYSNAFSQSVPVRTPPPPRALPTPVLSVVLNEKLSLANRSQVGVAARADAYQKLMKAQRLILNSSKLRSQNSVSTLNRSAMQVLAEALAQDPFLSEAYTALAELVVMTPPGDLEEGAALANLSLKVNPDNFGANKLSARLFTIKSRLNNGILDPNHAQTAIARWKDVVRLDPRNAEGWAFLSEFYARTGKKSERLDALRKWLASASPLEVQFFQRVMGGDSDLSPQNASVKLGTALLDEGKTREAIEILSAAVADDPQNLESVGRLRLAISSASVNEAKLAAEALQQAYFANPSNLPLVSLLAETLSKIGDLSRAEKVLEEAATRAGETDKVAAAALKVSLGDLLYENDKIDQAIKAYRSGILLREINAIGDDVIDDDREYMTFTGEKIIRVFKYAERFAEAKAEIERLRKALGGSDMFANRELIALYRDSGQRQLALKTANDLVKKYPNDYGAVRALASAMTDVGQVEAAVTMLKNFLPKSMSGFGDGDGSIAALPFVSEFMNTIYIASLYSQSGNGLKAILAAETALQLAKSKEEKTMAKLSLASAQFGAGKADAAEANLREILKEAPDYSVAQNNLGYFLAERGVKLDEAKSLIDSAIKFEPENSSYVDSLGWVQYKLKNYNAALPLLKKAFKADVSSATSIEHLADTLKALGNAAEARKLYRRAKLLATEKAAQLRLAKKSM